MADLSQSVCLNHPNTPAVTRCATCGKPICSQCIVSKNGSSYCSAKCADSAASSDGRVKDVLAEKKRTNAKGTIRALIIFFLIVAAAAAAYVFYTQNKDDVDRRLQDTAKQVRAGAKDAKKNIQKSVPKDSKYKRDREGLMK